MNFISSFPTLLAFTLYTLLFLGVSIMLLSIYYSPVYSSQIERWNQSNIPYLRSTVLIGHKYFSNLITKSPLVAIDQIYRENSDKDMIAFFMLTIPMILIRDPELIQQIFVKSFDKAFLTAWATGSEDDVEIQSMINFATDKARWKFARTTMAPAFSISSIKDSDLAKFNKKIDSMYDFVERTRQKGKPLDIKQISRDFLVDSISTWSFGVDTNSHERKSELHGLITQIFEPSIARIMSYYVTVFIPSIGVFDCLKLMNRKVIDTMADLLRRKIEYRDAHDVDENDFVDYLRSLRDKDVRTNTGGVERINFRQMVGFSIDMITAGTDSVTTLVVFLAHMLSLHPHFQNRIREEINDAMERHSTSEFTLEVVQDLHFTKQCLYETTRLYPVLPTIMRVCAEDFEIPGTKYTLRKGDRVVIDPYSVHRDPKYFKDPDKFDSERFSPQNEKAIPPYVYLGFGIGPRKCPGSGIGLLMSAILIASLVQKYELKPRSHKQHFSATDFDPKKFSISHRGDLLLDLVPCTRD